MIALRISEAAAFSIIEQADYYQKAADLALAQRWEAAVDQTIRSLLNWPELGAGCRFRSAALVGLRWVFVPGYPKHMVFYRFLHKEQTILIVQVLRGARDLESILDEDV